jgi:hypothetical protein
VARERIGDQEWIARAVRDRDAHERGAAQQIVMHGADLHDAVRRAAEYRQRHPAHPFPPEVRIGHQPDRDHGEHRDHAQHDEQPEQAAKHQ